MGDRDEGAFPENQNTLNNVGERKKCSPILTSEERKKLHTVYVGNLPIGAGKEDVFELFKKKIATPRDVFLQIVSDGQESKFGFVRFIEKASAVLAVQEMNGVSWRGRRLKVEEPNMVEQNSRNNTQKSILTKKDSYKAKIDQAEDLLQLWQLRQCVLQPCSGDHVAYVKSFMKNVNVQTSAGMMDTDARGAGQVDGNEKWNKLVAGMEKLQPYVFTADATEGEPFSLDIAVLEELVQECTTSKAGSSSLGHKSGKKKSRQPSAQKIKRETGQKTENAQTRLSCAVKSPAETGSESQLDQDVSPGSLSHRTAWRDTLKTGRHPGSDGCASLPTSPENKSCTESKTCYPGCESFKVNMKPEVSLETAKLKNARSPFSESILGPTSSNIPQQNKYGTDRHLVNIVSSEQPKETSPVETLSYESVWHSVSTTTNGMSSPKCILNSLQDISNVKVHDVTGDKVTGDKVTGDKVTGDKVTGDKVTGDKVTLDNRIVDTKTTVLSDFSTSPTRPNSGPFKTARNPLQFSN